MSDLDRVGKVADHPRIRDLGRNPWEQRRVDGFATDLARWLVGAEQAELGPLARVITVVAARELRDPKKLSRGRPILAIEAAARATEALWPLLRDDLEEPDRPPEEEPERGSDGASDAEAGATDDGASGSGEGADGDAGSTEDTDGDGDGEPDIAEALRELGDGDAPELDALAERLREALQPGQDIAAAAGELLSETVESAAKGALDAAKGLNALEHFLPGLGWSHGPGRLQRSLLSDVVRLSNLLQRVPALQQLADALGRMETASWKAAQEEGGSEEVAGVRFTGDVSRALPSEVGLLADETTEDLFYARWLERRLLGLELSGAGIDGVAEPEDKGPIIACIDTSGSMSGPPEIGAKALVLAICRRALPQGRTVHLLLFSGRDDLHDLRLRKGSGGLEAVLDFLAMSFYGGTDFDAPLGRAMDLLDEEELQKADVLVVTDGKCVPSEHVVRRVGAVRALRDVKVWSVVLGNRDISSVRPFSDEIWVLNPRTAAEAVGLLARFGRARGRAP